MTPEGVRKGYYTQPPEDAVIMWVRDIDSDDYARLLDHLERRTERAEGPA